MNTDREREMTFGDWLDLKMHEYGIRSDLALAKKLNVSHPTIGRWRAGAIPDVAQLRKLAELFHTPLVRLLVISGHATPEELGITHKPEPPEEPIIRMILNSPVSDEMKLELIDEWRRRIERERQLMRYRVRVSDVDEDGRALRLLELQEAARNDLAELVSHLNDENDDETVEGRRS